MLHFLAGVPEYTQPDSTTVPFVTTLPAAMIRVAFHNSIIQHNGSHADQYVVFDRAAVNHRIVGDGYVVPDIGGRLLVGGVYRGVILYVYFIADADGMYISAKHCAEPDATIVTPFHIAYDSGIIGEKTIFSEFGRMPFNFLMIAIIEYFIKPSPESGIWS